MWVKGLELRGLGSYRACHSLLGGPGYVMIASIGNFTQIACELYVH